MLTKEKLSQYKEFFFTNDDTCREVLQILALMSNKIRLQILCLLCEDEFYVNEIVEIVEGKASNVSQQLKMLSLAGYIKGARNEKNIHYSLKNGKIKKIIRQLQQMFT